MKPLRHHPIDLRRAPARGAFTLLEMLVSVTVLVFIIFGLYAMFAQTQKAFRGIAGEVDVLEGGRAAVELISRDLAQAVAGNLDDYTNFAVLPNGVISTPVVQIFPDGPGTMIHTNVLQDFFLLMRDGQRWKGHGYYVDRSPSGTNYNTSTNGFGTLYRFATNVAALNPTTPMLGGFAAASPSQTNSSVILDGVVHLTLRVFNANGADLLPSGVGYLAGDRIPHLVQLELGILEPDIVGQARALPTYTAFTNFLNQQAGKVHFFRQQVPIRAAVR